MKFKYKIFNIWIIGAFLTLSSVTVVQATVIWEDDFSDSLDEWDLKGFSYNNLWQNSVADQAIDSGFSIKDGILSGSVTNCVYGSVGGNWSLASHDSTTLFGSWSFDILMEKEPTGQAINTEIAFLYRESMYNLDWVGLSLAETFDATAGYILWINNLDDRSGGKLEMVLAKETGQGIGTRKNLDITTFETNLSTFHNINITRSSNYKIDVYFDEELKLEAQEIESNVLSTSERFVFFHWAGRFKFDNIIVSGNPETKTTFSSGLLMTGLSLITLVLLTKKK
ncbi:MAG: hypothetical protein ACW981_07405 [Candidatus Hodarchaeales archaeon]|jgi:hypothetical protein